MIYQSTYDNLLQLIHSVGVINSNQIKAFFSDAHDARKVEYYVKKLIVNREIVLSTKNDDDLICKSTPCPNADEMARRIRALWVPVSLRSSNIKEIISLQYPMSYLFVTSANEVYDVACISSSADVQLACSIMKYFSIPGVEDTTIHIALLDNAADVSLLSNTPFDAYCTVDKSGNVVYGEL